MYKVYIAIVLALFTSMISATNLDDEVFASRGKATITHGDFDAMIAYIPEVDRASFLRDSKRLEPILAQLLTFTQMAVDAREAGFHESEQIQARMRLAAERELAVAWVDYYVQQSQAPDLEALARESYLINSQLFMSERTIDVTHLLVSLDNRSDEEALEKVSQLLESVRKNPESFDELAFKHSEDPGITTNKGTYDGVKKGDMVKEFESVAFTLQIGEISEPVLTDYGYHLIRLNAVNKSKLISFDKFSAELMKAESEKHIKRIRLDYLNELGSAPVDITEDALRKMLIRYFGEDAIVEPTASIQE